MQYAKKSFSVTLGGTEAFRDGWERIFGHKEDAEISVPDPDAAERECLDREIDAMLTKPGAE